MTTNTSVWALRGLRPWTLLLWFPVCWSLLIAPVTDPTPGPHSVWGWPAAAAAALLFAGAVLTRYRSEAWAARTARQLLALLAVIAVVTTVAWSPTWAALFTLLVIGVGAVVVDRTQGPYLIMAITVLATATSLVGGAKVDTALTTALTVLLVGLGTYAVHQLFAAVSELRCTREELARMAVTAERERFGRDLHDLLGHTLSVIVVKAEAVRRLAPLDSTAAAAHAADIETIGREALTDIRRAASGYRGSGLDRELARARAALDAAGVALTLDLDPDLARALGAGPTSAASPGPTKNPGLAANPGPAANPVPGASPPRSGPAGLAGAPAPDGTAGDLDVLFGWVVREGVTNVVRHARATRCTIRIRPAGPSVRMTIEDDGSGAEPSRGSGAGLLGLSERVAAAGGILAAVATDPGFRVTVDVPAPAVALPPGSARMAAAGPVRLR